MQRWRFKKADGNNRNQNQFLIITIKFEDAVILPCCFMQLYSKQQSCPGHLYFSFAHGTTQNKLQICLKNLCTIQCGLVWSIRSYKMYLFLVELEEGIKKLKIKKKKRNGMAMIANFLLSKLSFYLGMTRPLSPTVLLNRKALYPLLGDLYIW